MGGIQVDESEFSSLTHLNQVGVFLEILSLDSVQGSNLWSWVEPGRLYFFQVSHVSITGR